MVTQLHCLPVELAYMVCKLLFRPEEIVTLLEVWYVPKARFSMSPDILYIQTNTDANIAVECGWKPKRLQANDYLLLKLCSTQVIERCEHVFIDNCLDVPLVRFFNSGRIPSLAMELKSFRMNPWSLGTKYWTIPCYAKNGKWIATKVQEFYSHDSMRASTDDEYEPNDIRYVFECVFHRSNWSWRRTKPIYYSSNVRVFHNTLPVMTCQKTHVPNVSFETIPTCKYAVITSGYMSYGTSRYRIDENPFAVHSMEGNTLNLAMLSKWTKSFLQTKGVPHIKIGYRTVRELGECDAQRISTVITQFPNLEVLGVRFSTASWDHLVANISARPFRNLIQLKLYDMRLNHTIINPTKIISLLPNLCLISSDDVSSINFRALSNTWTYVIGHIYPTYEEKITLFRRFDGMCFPEGVDYRNTRRMVRSSM